MSTLTVVNDNPRADDQADERWEVHGVSPDPRRAAPRVRGSLDIRPRLLDSRLTLTTESLVVDARLSGIDDDGGWRFEGLATSDRRRAPVTVHARHHGVYRHGDRATAWLTLSAEREPAPGRGLLPWRPGRPRSLFRVEVNAEPSLS